ncbi:hypothetical protein LX32DRAFT_326730 [Colletotrichum zoysiae]|uniref:Uncharacterized protein n=1 Tax=Colletotrichum zoysiae TaxID=1216348 RepID=A0AAD9HKA2_9PEZI|nr:hypothetical protein LX32DRAFT_326730 [Colletotrichum zoysiae]
MQAIFDWTIIRAGEDIRAINARLPVSSQSKLRLPSSYWYHTIPTLLGSQDALPQQALANGSTALGLAINRTSRGPCTVYTRRKQKSRRASQHARLRDAKGRARPEPRPVAMPIVACHLAAVSLGSHHAGCQWLGWLVTHRTHKYPGSSPMLATRGVAMSKRSGAWRYIQLSASVFVLITPNPEPAGGGVRLRV